MLMDDGGIVPWVMRSRSLTEKDGSRPFGIKVDSEKMIRAVDRIWDEADVIGVEWGDTCRAEDYRYNLMDQC